MIGKNAVEIDPHLVYVSIINNRNSARVIVYCGKYSSTIINAGFLAKLVSSVLDGSGGGSINFGQGGGKLIEKLSELKPIIQRTIEEKIG